MLNLHLKKIFLSPSNQKLVSKNDFLSKNTSNLKIATEKKPIIKKK